MEKALWPSQTEILKSLPRQQTQGDENEYAQNQNIQIAYLLPEEIMGHEQNNQPQNDKEQQMSDEIAQLDGVVETMMSELTELREYKKTSRETQKKLKEKIDT